MRVKWVIAQISALGSIQNVNNHLTNEWSFLPEKKAKQNKNVVCFGKSKL